LRWHECDTGQTEIAQSIVDDLALCGVEQRILGAVGDLFVGLIQGLVLAISVPYSESLGRQAL